MRMRQVLTLVVGIAVNLFGSDFASAQWTIGNPIQGQSFQKSSNIFCGGMAPGNNLGFVVNFKDSNGFTEQTAGGTSNGNMWNATLVPPAGQGNQWTSDQFSILPPPMFGWVWLTSHDVILRDVNGNQLKNVLVHVNP